MVFTKNWWKAAAIRAVRTMAQTAVATIGTTAVIESVNWLTVLSASALAGILSMLTSVAGLPEVEETINQEENCHITVKAYEHYDANGDPIREPEIAREVNENNEHWGDP